MRFTAQPSPSMLTARPRANTTVGPTRANPSDSPRAVAHTASNTALPSSAIQCISAHRLQADDGADEQHQQQRTAPCGPLLTGANPPQHGQRGPDPDPHRVGGAGGQGGHG